MRYLFNFVNADTRLPGLTNVIALVNGVPSLTTGPIATGTSRILDLGLCRDVANFDFVFKFISLVDGTEKTASPDPTQPPIPALASCSDGNVFDIGKEVYGP